MKHVFGVSSHLAFYLCNHLIETDYINPDDCIFFTTRDYMIPQEYTTLYKKILKTSYNISPTQGRIFAGINIWKTKKNIDKFDQTIDEILKGESFIWYTQICFNDFCSLMVTKSNCVGYYIIEDGSGSYKRENKPIFIGLKGIIYHTILKPLYPRLFILKNRMIETNHPKFKGCIASTDMCFPLHKEYTRVIGLPFKPTPLSEAPDAILSIDPMFMWIPLDKTKEVFQKLSTHINTKNYKTIAYKHHPYTLSTTNNEIYALYNKLIKQLFKAKLIELEPTVSLENTLMFYKCDFYTAVSSVAIYAKAMNINCFSYMPLLRPYTNLSVPIIEELCSPIK